MEIVWQSPLPKIDTTPALLHEELLGRAQQWPERVALIDGVTGRTLTFGELAGAAR